MNFNVKGGALLSPDTGSIPDVHTRTKNFLTCFYQGIQADSSNILRNLGIFRNLRKLANLLKFPQWCHQVKPFYSERIVSKLMSVMAKNTSLRTHQKHW
jgi:hypothetical protein